MKILIIGESCKDIFHYGYCKRLCPEAPVPVFNSSGLVENGGMAKNTYNNVVALGASADLITNENWESISKTRFVDKRTNHMFMRLDENDAGYGKCNLSQISFRDYKAVIVSDYDKGFLSIEDLQAISTKHHLTFLDTKKSLGNWCKNFTFIKINNSEYEKTLDSIDGDINQRLIITQGPHGCLYQDKTYEVPLVEVKDTSGAGDTFVAAMCVKYCESSNVEESLKFANHCATVVVQKKGVATI
tara:strand:- start:7708 stop:8439 length:732 start_codon:yes stop_codon:yes gene_type:complete